MILKLCRLPADRVCGAYTIKGVADRMPDRALLLQPDAARSFMADLARVVTVSDMFRSPESSLAAVRAGRGAKAPGFSGHNYGLSIDLDVEATMKRIGHGKRALDLWMAEHGWFCHRSDHAMPSWKPINEAWHWNFLPGHTWGKSSPAALEARIVEQYGEGYSLDVVEQQMALRDQGLYRGEVDGDAGPLTREALRAFQRTWGLKERTWGLKETGKADVKTQRTLAYVDATIEEVPL